MFLVAEQVGKQAENATKIQMLVTDLVKKTESIKRMLDAYRKLLEAIPSKIFEIEQFNDISRKHSILVLQFFTFISVEINL